LDSINISSYQVKLMVILIPTIIYGILFFGQKFPATERLQSGVSGIDMIRATLLRPLFWILIICMMMTASIELGPNRWIPAVLEASGIHGILVLVWINLLMAIMRYKAGPVVHKLSPTGILLTSAIVSGIGLYWLSYTETLTMAIIAGTIFALGVSYFWPTMLGVTSERVPKGGALALALVGGVGTIIVGLVTSPLMGNIADNHVNDKLPFNETKAVLEQIVETFPQLRDEKGEKTVKDYNAAIKSAKDVLNSMNETGTIPEISTANAMRSAMAVDPGSDAAKEAKKILGPAENYGGKISFRSITPFSIILVVIFGIMYFRDRRAGGYKAEII
jgi:hypothetical protein